MGGHLRHPLSHFDSASRAVLKYAASFFTDETYTTIENEQHVLTEYRLPGSIERGYYSEDATAPTTFRSVQHVLLPEREESASDKDLNYFSSSFIHKVYKLAGRQHSVTKRYSADISGEKVFFVIKKASPLTARMR